MFKFKSEKLNGDQLIGKGAFGSVFPYQSNPKDDRYVVKFIFASNIDKLQMAMQEIVLAFSCNHPNILPINGFFMEQAKPTGTNVYIKMPRMQGHLRQIIVKNQLKKTFIPQDDIIRYFYGLASALEYLHNRRIVHRDIKPENILLDKSGKVQLTDVGGAKIIGEEESINLVSDIAGTTLYLAPEVADRTQQVLKKNLNKTDIWSLGLVMAELCLLIKVDGLKEADFKRKFAEAKSKWNNNLVDLILGCLKNKPDLRKTAAEIRKTLEAHFGSILEAETTTADSFGDPEDMKIIQSKKADSLSKSLRSIAEVNEEAKSEEYSLFSSLSFSKKKTTEKWQDHFSVKAVGFEASVQKASGVKDSSIKDFMLSMIKKLDDNNAKNIQDVSISLEGCEKITDSGIQAISSGIVTHLRSLKSLNLNFANCKLIGNIGLKILGNYLSANLIQLEHLDLDFRGCREISGEGTKDLVSYVAPSLRRLRHFGLNLYSCPKIRDQAVVDIVQYISSYLKDLSQLKLTFSYCEAITDVGLRNLAYNIGTNLKALQVLELHFVSCKQISDGGLTDIATHICGNLVNLTHLDLNFGVWDKVIDHETKDRTAHLEANHKNLSHIGLGVKDNRKISDLGIINLMTSIGDNLKNLEHLGLNFSYFSKMTDIGVNSIASALGGNLKNLRHLDLNLSYCKQITDIGLNNLVSSLGTNLPELEELTLNFWNCNKITDEGIKDFSNYIAGHLTKLKYLDIDFDCCVDVTDRGFTDLVGRVRTSLKNLKYLRIHFWNCPKISAPVKNSLKVLLECIPKIETRL